MVRLAVAGLAALAAAPGVAAQAVAISAARWFADPDVADYRLSVSSYRLGPLRLAPFGQLARSGPTGDRSLLAGFGGDLTVNLAGTARPYLVLGASLGAGLSGGFDPWTGWSAGAGYELFRLGPIGVGVEARYQELSRDRVEALSLGLRIGSALGRGTERTTSPAREAPAPPSATETTATSAAATRPAPEPERRPIPLATAAPAAAAAPEASAAVEMALGAMGTPYRWGGTDTNGFDCSGLIQYAYARAGIAVPRRSADQARAGRPVEPRFAELRTGDILTFAATPGGPVTHVGLYLGDGRFIHSTSTGTRASRLASDDPDGKWWFARWVGARRVAE